MVDSDRIAAVQWGKLLVNLTNAPNALSGLTVQVMLLDRGWRRIMAAQMVEAMGILRAAGIAFDAPFPVSPRLVPHVLRLPTPLFRRVARAMLSVDAQARTSMALDLAQGRPTEVDALQGEIIRLAAAQGRDAPWAAPFGLSALIALHKAHRDRLVIAGPGIFEAAGIHPVVNVMLDPPAATRRPIGAGGAGEAAGHGL